MRLYGLGVGLNGTPTGDEGTVPITCLKMPTRVDEQGRSLFRPYLATYRLKYANWIEEHLHHSIVYIHGLEYDNLMGKNNAAIYFMFKDFMTEMSILSMTA